MTPALSKAQRVLASAELARRRASRPTKTQEKGLTKKAPGPLQRAAGRAKVI